MVLWHLFICVVLRKIGNDTKFAVPRNPFHLRNVYINTIGMTHIKPLHPTHITHVRLHMPSTHVRCMKHETTPNRTSTTDASVKSNMSKILQFIFAVILASTPTNRLSIAKYKLYLCVVRCARISPKQKLSRDFVQLYHRHGNSKTHHRFGYHAISKWNTLELWLTVDISLPIRLIATYNHNFCTVCQIIWLAAV